MEQRDGAAAVVVWAGQVCLVQRRNPPDAGLWGYPGGHVDPGETAPEAALRELREETGLIGRALRELGALDIGGVDGPRFRLAFVEVARVAGVLGAADDAIAAAWVPVARVLAPDRPMSRDVDTILRRALSPPDQNPPNGPV